MNPKLSIIVPIYNVDTYLEICIKSILNQTFKDFELILVNDGSTDKCIEICREYEKIDSRIIVINKVNGGVSSARNAGIEIAKGKYIAFIDPDDDIEKNMYEVLVNKAIETDSDITICSYRFIDLIDDRIATIDLAYKKDITISKLEIEKELIPKIMSNKSVYGYGMYSSVNKLYKKSLFNDLRFDEKMHHGEDKKLNLMIISEVNKISFVQDTLYNYYIRKRNSLTQVVRKDLYQYIIENKNNHIFLCNKYDCKELISKGLIDYMNTTMKYMIDVCGCEFKFKTKKDIISNIMNHSEFKNQIKSYECPNKFHKLLKKACVKKSSTEFIGYIYMLNFKQNVNKLVRR